MWAVVTLQMLGWPERLILLLLVVVIVAEVLRLMP